MRKLFLLLWVSTMPLKAWCTTGDNYVLLNPPKQGEFTYYADYADFYNSVTKSHDVSNTVIPFRQIDFTPLKIVFKWCKEIWFVTVCGSEEKEFSYGKVISDKDVPGNETEYKGKFFQKITDVTAFYSYLGPTTYLSNANILTTVILDSEYKKLTFLREGLEPWYYDGSVDNIHFFNPIAVKEIGGIIYVLDDDYNRNPVIHSLKINHSPDGNFSMQYLGKIDRDTWDGYKLRYVTDVSGFIKNGTGYLFVSDEVGIHVMNLNTLTGEIMKG